MDCSLVCAWHSPPAPLMCQQALAAVGAWLRAVPAAPAGTCTPTHVTPAPHDPQTMGGGWLWRSRCWGTRRRPPPTRCSTTVATSSSSPLSWASRCRRTQTCSRQSELSNDLTRVATSSFSPPCSASRCTAVDALSSASSCTAAPRGMLLISCPLEPSCGHHAAHWRRILSSDAPVETAARQHCRLLHYPPSVHTQNLKHWRSAVVGPGSSQVVNLVTNRVSRLLGKVENTERFLRIALYQVQPPFASVCVL